MEMSFISPGMKSSGQKKSPGRNQGRPYIMHMRENLFCWPPAPSLFEIFTLTMLIVVAEKAGQNC